MRERTPARPPQRSFGPRRFGQALFGQRAGGRDGPLLPSVPPRSYGKVPPMPSGPPGSPGGAGSVPQQVWLSSITPHQLCTATSSTLLASMSFSRKVHALLGLGMLAKLQGGSRCHLLALPLWRLAQGVLGLHAKQVPVMCEQGAKEREGPFPPDDELAGTWEALSLDDGGQAILERRDVWGFPDAPDLDPPRNRGIRFG